MKCSACGAREETTVRLDAGPDAVQCRKCGGHWVSSKNYDAWRSQSGPPVPARTDPAVEVRDSQKAKMCPECGRIMAKYRVGHGLDFYLDHCDGCGGVWLDPNEWEALRSKGLHDSLHQVFSSAWQKQVREDEARRVMEQTYLKRFGAEAFEKAKEAREWIHRHPEKQALIAFLADEEPYSPSGK